MTAKLDEQLSKATRMIATGLVHMRPDSTRGERQAEVIRAAREALDDTAGGRWKSQTMEADGKPEVMLSTAGVFRLVLKQNRDAMDDPYFQEGAMAVIQRTLAEV